LLERAGHGRNLSCRTPRVKKRDGRWPTRFYNSGMSPASVNDDVWFSLLPHGATVHDQEGTVVRFNPSALSLLGLTEDQLCGRVPYDPQWHLVNEDLSPCPPSQLPGLRALAGKPVEAVMGVFLAAEGRYRWLHFHSQPHDGPQGRRVLSLFED